MARIKKLLVPTDLSENSRRGLLYAYSMAAENGAAVTILHVANEFAAWEFYSDEFSFLEPAGRAWPTDRALAEAGRDLDRFLEPNLEALKRVSSVNKRVVLGRIAEQIVMAAEEGKAELIVMSPRHHRRWGRLLSRSITERVTRMSPCPVLSVTPPLPSRPWRGKPRPIFFGWAKQRPASI